MDVWQYKNGRRILSYSSRVYGVGVDALAVYIARDDRGYVIYADIWGVFQSYLDVDTFISVGLSLDNDGFFDPDENNPDSIYFMVASVAGRFADDDDDYFAEDEAYIRETTAATKASLGYGI